MPASSLGGVCRSMRGSDSATWTYSVQAYGVYVHCKGLDHWILHIDNDYNLLYMHVSGIQNVHGKGETCS